KHRPTEDLGLRRRQLTGRSPVRRCDHHPPSLEGAGGWQMEREAPSPGDRRMARLPCDGECAGSGPSGWSVTWQGYNQGKVSTKN
ncbi:MAG: hypothetical protein OXC82_13870, partial [Rhodobacteraceae bacterium]|nr:hypothetical protein [Paracoccaceae bacterium]